MPFRGASKPLPSQEYLQRNERIIIERFARGDEELREEAIAIYRNNRERMHSRASDHMRFMREASMPEISNEKVYEPLLTYCRKVLKTQWNEGIYIG